jgi:hypothetical protein
MIFLPVVIQLFNALSCDAKDENKEAGTVLDLFHNLGTSVLVYFLLFVFHTCFAIPVIPD